jgi:hypothetical protein
MTSGKRDLVILLVLVLAMATVPAFVGTRYIITTLTLFFIWTIVVTQWNLVLGVAGIFSLAQMALFAVGAYGTAMLGYYFGMTMPPAMLLAALATVLVSLVVGLACLRLAGPYVALLTRGTSRRWPGRSSAAGLHEAQVARGGMAWLNARPAGRSAAPHARSAPRSPAPRPWAASAGPPTPARRRGTCCSGPARCETTSSNPGAAA